MMASKGISPSRMHRSAIWPLSARTREGVVAVARRLGSFLDDNPEVNEHDVARTLGLGRSHFEWRTAVVGTGRAELRSRLDAVVTESETAVARVSEVVPGFVFPGQGSQWVGMATELARESPAFASKLEECSSALDSIVDWDLKDVLSDCEALERDDIVAPALCAVMISLAELWRSVGVKPEFVVGHSQGEIAAAAVSGVISLEDALRIAVARSALVVRNVPVGAMAAVEMSATGFDQMSGTTLDIAAINGPRAIVVAGGTDEVDAFVLKCADSGIRARVLPVGYASHTAAMDPIVEPLLSALSGVVARPSDVRFVSSVTGGTLDGGDLGPRYWADNIRKTVRFFDAVEHIADGTDRPPAFIECSPHPLMLSSLADTVDNAVLLGSLEKDAGGYRQFLESVGRAYCGGVSISWNAVVGAGRIITLPGYPFARTRLAPEFASRPARHHPADEPALVLRPSPGSDRVYEAWLSVSSHVWLRQHRVGGVAVLPAAALIVWLDDVAGRNGLNTIVELVVERAILLDDVASLAIEITCTDVGTPSGELNCVIRTRSGDDSWSTAASAVLGARDEADGSAVASDTDDQVSRLRSWNSAADAYEDLDARGNCYGPKFQLLDSIAFSDGYTEARLTIPERSRGTDFNRCTTVIDAILQPTLIAAGVSSVAFSIEGIKLHEFLDSGVLRVKTTCLHEARDYSVFAVDAHSGRPIVDIARLTLHPTSTATLVYEVGRRELNTNTDVDVVDVVALGDLPPGISSAISAAGLSIRAIEQRPLPSASVAITGFEYLKSSSQELPNSVYEATRLALHMISEWVATYERREPVKLVLVNRLLDRSGTPRESLVGACVTGIFRSAAAEHPELFAVVDVDSNSRSWRLLGKTLTRSERHLEIVQGVLRSRALTPASISSDEHRPDPRSILIVGGGGHIAGRLGSALAQRYPQASITLLGRRGAAAENLRRNLAALDELGSTADALACDITDRDALHALLLDRQYDTVIHACGELADSSVAGMSDAALRIPQRSKIDGLTNLHDATEQMRPERFIVLSSIASFIGTPGQANYVSANVFVDAYVRSLNDQGHPALSVMVGLWPASTGLTAGLGQAELDRFARDGLAPMSDSDATAAILSIFDCDGVFVVCGCSQTVQVLERTAGYRSVTSAPVPASLKREPTDLPKTLEALHAAIERHLIGVLGRNGSLDHDTPFSDLGLDSMKALELRNAVNRHFDLRLPATVMFDHPTVRKLSSALWDKASHARNRDSAANLAAQIDAMVETIDAMDNERLRESPKVRSALLRLASVSRYDTRPPPEESTEHDELEQLSDAELMRIVDKHTN